MTVYYVDNVLIFSLWILLRCRRYVFLKHCYFYRNYDLTNISESHTIFFLSEADIDVTYWNYFTTKNCDFQINIIEKKKRLLLFNIYNRNLTLIIERQPNWQIDKILCQLFSEILESLSYYISSY